MKRLALAVAIAAASLLLPATALAGGALPGKYTTKISSPATLKGTWTLTFLKGGTYTVADNGAVAVLGRYTTKGSKLTLGHEIGALACAKTGMYTWKRSGKSLTLTRVNDKACSGRSTVLSHTFKLA